MTYKSRLSSAVKHIKNEPESTLISVDNIDDETGEKMTVIVIDGEVTKSKLDSLIKNLNQTYRK